MPRIIDYPESNQPDENEVVLIDGSQGTKKLKIKNLLKSIWDKFTEVDEEISDVNEDLKWVDVTSEFSFHSSLYGKVLHQVATRSIRVIAFAKTSSVTIANSSTLVTIPSKYSVDSTKLSPTDYQNTLGVAGLFGARFANTTPLNAFTVPCLFSTNNVITANFPVSGSVYRAHIDVTYQY